ncbi:hypothetical protein ACK8P5_25985 (plasmid) [Paenibacillus sp. EC2-1]|uniref:hypothetical protein n=1 Tax=Paenibacillus sp. EC2-1 TaxID=3388665 RepID=UPI003BEEB04B
MNKPTESFTRENIDRIASAVDKAVQEEVQRSGESNPFVIAAGMSQAIHYFLIALSQMTQEQLEGKTSQVIRDLTDQILKALDAGNKQERTNIEEMMALIHSLNTLLEYYNSVVMENRNE